MSRTKKIAVLAIIAMVLTMLPVQLFAATTAAESTRLYGAGRVETSLQVCDAGWTTANTVVVAPADQANLVDALAAAPLAGQENAPILLTFKGSLDAAVKAKIAALGAKKVYAVGALADSVKTELAAMSGVTVEALKGDSRWDTTKAINAKLTSPAGTFVVGYAALADALSVSSFAAANKYAIVLAGVDGKIPAGQSVLGSKTYLVGGSTLVADITGATRLAGADRFETNKKVLETLSFEYAKVYVANGFNNHLVDSLVAAPLAAKVKAPIVLASDSAVAAKDFVNSKLTSTSVVVALGGTGVVPDSVRDNVKYNEPAKFAVESVEPVGLGQVKVVFNQEVNETNAELASNYKIGTTTLGATECAVRQTDKKTVLVTFAASNSQSQAQKSTFTVLAGILNASGTQTSAKYEKELTFNDTTVPVAESAKATGNKKVTITFSEPVLMTALASGVKIDGVAHTAAGSGVLSALNGATEGATGDEAANAGAGVAPYWANKLQINFNAALSVGNHTVTIPKGNATDFVDRAGFVVPETTLNFTVENVTGAPEVSSVEASDNGIVTVTFNRDMDTSAAGGADSALTVANYMMNTAGNTPTVSAPAKVDSRSDKFKMTFVSGVVKAGSNVLILDKDMKDAWGNKLSTGTEDIRISFTAGGDTTKPEVTSVNLTGNESTGAKITVKFSEDVDGAFASTATNYKLKNSSGDTISFAGATFLNKNGGTTSSDTWVITLTSQLTDSSYTLEVKNIIDLASTPNRIDTVVKSFSVGDTVKPTVLAAYESTTANKVLVQFSEAMNASVLELKNYYYIEQGGSVKDLPSGTTISKESDKLVSIKFPNGVVVNPGSVTPTDIVSIRVANVADLAGNGLAGGSSDKVLTTAALATTITINDRTIVAKKVGDDIHVVFETSEALSTISLAEFKFGALAGRVAPDAYSIAGKEVTLKFYATTALGANVAAIKAAGTTAALAVTVDGTDAGLAPAATMNADGRLIAQYGTGAGVGLRSVYDDQIAPEITGFAVSGATTIDITFSEALDNSIYGLYKDDFTFEMGGNLLTPTLVGPGAGQNVLRYTFGTNLVSTVNVRAVADKIDIKDLKTDVAETQNVYVPTTANKGNNAIAETVPPTVVPASTKMLTATTFQVVFSEPVNCVAGDFTNYKYDADGAGPGASVAIAVVSITGSGTNTITVTTAANAGFVTTVGTGVVDLGAGIKDLVNNPLVPVVAQPILTD